MTPGIDSVLIPFIFPSYGDSKGSLKPSDGWQPAHVQLPTSSRLPLLLSKDLDFLRASGHAAKMWWHMWEGTSARVSPIEYFFTSGLYNPSSDSLVLLPSQKKKHDLCK